ncbi:L-glutamate gamma-semialdehyde dehydrogenase [Occallatibacter riparius]|uniref:L-glutamate gamma-semialdehyde dehydrogenase n=1 Tax=Occallatibacter riparius TaxID=1002689 RepID=A0A9J7BXS2_9BACT|nr:L-glutamate gamma-semialdehyde dehydrogenase [Occallatibacter riparius]UWZ86778.1 L-glutamate gamma-semialdehyde dehydrogenase [Occallatibacter riparius]
MATVTLPTAIQPRSPQGEFRNEPFTNFKSHENHRAMQAALDLVAGQLGHEYDLVIGGEHSKTAEKIRSINPARPSQVVGIHQKAGAEHAEKAMQAALAAFETWSRTTVEERTSLLLNAADIIRKRKFEFCAWLTYEVGKNWAEADADVGETIDFLEFYSREALRLAAATTPIQYPGEKNQLLYIPLGVGAVIPPWNFPFAIMAGMTAASIVTGNTVVLKPSSDSPTIAAKFVEVLEEAGMPGGVVNFCPGSGATFGNAIVEHPKTRFIAFTGSKAVGLDIHERAAKNQPGQIWIKRTILEMGGKDSIIVSADADLDAAVDGVVAAAFGFSGQKCSACSRAIVDASVYEIFVERVREKVAQLTVGDAAQNPSMGPVVNKGSYESILNYIETGKKEGRLVAGGKAVENPDGGYLIEPTVFADIAPDAVLAQEEIFGPVLAIIKVENFDEALAVANNTEYGLTGAIYSDDRAKLDIARREFHVGNLYLNRKCTGAMVGAHPFGGFNMSGTDSKAGGPDYLLLFTQAKSVAEKVIAKPSPTGI